MRVLVADDDATLRYGLTAQLERWGYEPVVCVDGDAAREVLQGDAPPPMAILDWNMPGTDGVALCQEIRATPALAPTYVVLLTARDTLDEMVSGLDRGADEYITKPFDWEVLRARLNTGARIAQLQQQRRPAQHPFGLGEGRRRVLDAHRSTCPGGSGAVAAGSGSARTAA